MLIFLKTSQRICRHLYFLHEFANFLNRGLFDFQQLGLLEKFLLHVYKLALKFLQSLPPLFAQPKSRSNTSRSLTPGLKSIKATLQAYLAWLVSFFADWRAKTSSSFSFWSESTAVCRVWTFFCGTKRSFIKRCIICIVTLLVTLD